MSSLRAVRPPARALVAGLVTAGSVLLPLTVGPTAPAGAEPEPGDPGRLMLVLDSSGSMAEPASGGGTKIEAAKTALHQVVDGLPSDAEVGMRVYGAEVFSRDDAGACTDSQRVVDLGTDNRDALHSAIDDYTPYGETPIGYALQEAAADLGDEGQRSIVLVSDGEPTCPPDPCQVARQLSRQGVDVRIDVVGLDVDGPAEEALRCIADNGNGTYYDADDSEDLTDALETLATRAARPYQPTGLAVTGSADATSAPTITAGSYVDQIGGIESPTGTLHYAVERTVPGSSVTVSATILTPYYVDRSRAQDEWDRIDLELTTPEGQTCDTDAPARARSMDATALTVSVDADECADAETLVARVTRSDGADFPTPLELAVVEEPPVVDAMSLPAPAEDAVTWQAPEGSRPAAATGGSSFAESTPISPGTLRGTLVPGEVQTFSVDIGWGQQLATTMTIADPSGPLAEELPQIGTPVAVGVYGPTRADAVAQATGAPPAFAKIFPSGGVQVGATTAPVTYRNREATGTDPLRAAATAGQFTIVVSMADDQARASYEVPFVLDVGVTGEVTGAPEYDLAEEPTETPSTAPETTMPSDAPADTGDEPATAAEDDTDGDGMVLALLGGGALVVLLVVAVLALLLLRRSRRQA